MSNEQEVPKKLSLFRFSLDTWSVIAAFVLAAFVRIGVLRHIPW